MTKIVQALGLAFGFTGQSVPDEVLREMAKELNVFPEHDVLLALQRCRSELKAIKFSDILDRLPGQHPGIEQAWSVVSTVMNDEERSICWTNEMRESFGAAVPLKADRVAARLAFKEVYVNLVSESRAKRMVPKWSVSLGQNKVLRDECVEEAAKKNMISQEYATKLLGHDVPTPHALGIMRALGMDGTHDAR